MKTNKTSPRTLRFSARHGLPQGSTPASRDPSELSRRQRKGAIAVGALFGQTTRRNCLLRKGANLI